VWRLTSPGRRLAYRTVASCTSKRAPTKAKTDHTPPLLSERGSCIIPGAAVELASNTNASSATSQDDGVSRSSQSAGSTGPPRPTRDWYRIASMNTAYTIEPIAAEITNPIAVCKAVTILAPHPRLFVEVSARESASFMCNTADCPRSYSRKPNKSAPAALPT
jgi:hypothetical protein